MALLCYLSIVANRQGPITGSVTTSRHAGKIQPIRVEHTIRMPIDRLHQRLLGTEEHRPMTFTKVMDRASPMLSVSLASGETLDSCTFEYYVPTHGHGTDPSLIVTLEDAFISEIETWEPKPTEPDFLPIGYLEKVALIYDRIRWQHMPSGHEAQRWWVLDPWDQRGESRARRRPPG